GAAPGRQPRRPLERPGYPPRSRRHAPRPSSARCSRHPGRGSARADRHLPQPARRRAASPPRAPAARHRRPLAAKSPPRLLAARLLRRAHRTDLDQPAISACGAALALTLVGLTENVTTTTVGLVLLVTTLALLASIARLLPNPRSLTPNTPSFILSAAKNRGA